MVGEEGLRRDVLAGHVGEVPPQRGLAVLGAERRDHGTAAGLAAQVGDVLVAVGDRDEQPAGPQHTAYLREAAVEVGHVVEHPHRRDDVEGRVLERQRLHVGDLGADAAGRGQLDEAG